MYINVISLKNGKTLPFKTEIPFSADKLEDGFMVVSDEENGQIISFRGSEVVSIASQDLNKQIKPLTRNRPPRVKKSPGIVINK